MTERIALLTDLTLKGKMFNYTLPTEFDKEDLFLTRQHMESKRLSEFILNQEPVLTPYQKFTGYFNCNDSVVGDVFRRKGHKGFYQLFDEFYLKNIDNISTFEWQHANADYRKLLTKGIKGIIEEIDLSLNKHDEPEKKEFLLALKRVAKALIDWAHKCSKRVLEFSKTIENKEYKSNLEKLSKALLNVPENKPSSFYEAVLSMYICFSADPDSVGTLDRHLSPFYFSDIKKGVLTRDEAKEYLQELYLMLQSATEVGSRNFTRGGESHFCIGGYLPDGSEAYNELSELIIESLIELPTFIPQVTLRWTKNTPREVLRFAMDMERKDPHKRIAFQNDEKRIKCYTEICGFSYEQAVSYTTVGCNEPAFPGSVSGGTSHINFARSTANLFHEKSHLIENVKTFDEYYDIFFKEVMADMDIGYAYDDKYNSVRARDINYLSSIFFQGTIEKAKSATQGAGDVVIASCSLTGITNVIDSLIIVKQFVFDEKIVTMPELISALKADWMGYEDLRTLILKKGDFFGNDTERSNYVAQKLYNSMYEFLKDKKNLFGYQRLIGDLIGYNEHHKWDGERTKATPDGRKAGSPLKFGIGQSEGKDRNGLTALLNSVAKIDKTGIGCGSTITNVSIDEALIKDDDNFEKTVDMFENYFKNGGVHFQLTYVSKEDLIKAQEIPEDYKHIRVRVSGFSEFFVKLNNAIQDDIIARTDHKR